MKRGFNNGLDSLFGLREMDGLDLLRSSLNV